MSAEFALGVALAALLGLVPVVVWAARLDVRVEELRKAVESLAGQQKGSPALEKTHRDPRPADLTDRKLHAEPLPYTTLSALRTHAEKILRQKREAQRQMQAGGSE